MALFPLFGHWRFISLSTQYLIFLLILQQLFDSCLLVVLFFINAAYVGLATIAGFVWWFVYSENGPGLPYSELVSWQFGTFLFLC
jgi:hypothetical protein